MAFSKKTYKASLNPEAIRDLPNEFGTRILAKACNVQHETISKWILQKGLPTHSVKKTKTIWQRIKKEEFIQWAKEEGRLMMP